MAVTNTKHRQTYVHSHSAHVCVARVDNTVLARGTALAVERAPYVTPAVLLVPAVGLDNAAVTRFPPGWACAVPTEVERLDETTTLHLTRWFDDGQRSGKTKCSAAQALSRLEALCDADGSPLYAADELPSEKRVKRFFSGLAQKARAVARESV